ncbi:LPO_1073/Vpar_1526 family protein [Caballeronia cordobensis]|uniref:LPO_1073/Vpar_1526 family protein n=1 Tax=Caballeronia cordobensis TaxID=1353886 RepID=UPI0005ED7891
MLNNDQNQLGGDGAVNAQAGRDVIVHGVTYADARQIAIDVYRANALELQGIAQQVARERAEHLIDQFLEKMQATGAERIEEAANPDFQHALYEAQKAYARSGDTGMEGVLVNLLVERADEPNRTLRQVVLNEAVTAAARLTPEQVTLLTVIFCFRHCRNTTLGSHDQLRDHFASLLPLCAAIPETESVYTYLAYSGVVTVEMGEARLPEILRQTYPGLFSRGFEDTAFAAMREREPAAMQHVGNCLLNPALKQVHALNDDVLRALTTQSGISEQSRNELSNLLKQNLMDDQQMIELFAPLGEPAARLFRLWSSTAIRQCLVTAVGMAIAHANARRLGMIDADLGVWVR